MQTIKVHKSEGGMAGYLIAAGVLLMASTAFAGVRTVSASIDSADSLLVALGEASGTTNTLFMAYGASSGGDSPAAWDKAVRVGVVPPETSSLVVVPPAGWESTVHAVRFFAVDGALDGDLPVEYIAGEDANVSFPLKYVPTSDTRTQIKFMYTHANGSTFFGTQYGTDDGNDYRFFQGGNNTAAYFDVGSARITSDNVLTDPAVIRHFEFGNHYVKDLDTGSDIVRAESAVDLTGYASTLQLFAGGDYGRVYSLTIYEGETPALDLEPCLKVDGTPALRDTLTGDFYEATGAGVVSSGKPKVLLDGETQKQMSAVVEDAVSAAPVPGDYAKRLRVTPDAIAVQGATTFSDVPILLRLSTSITGFSYSDFTRGGKDMLILDQEGTALSYEIETWNPNGESLVWVKVPLLSVHTQLMAYYGDEHGRRNGANDPRQVWSAYAGVWHMDEQQTAGSCADSSPNAYHTQNQDGNTGATGFLGGARDATSGGMIVPGTTAMNLGSSFTVMGLVTRTSTAGGKWDHLFYKKNASGDWGGWCVEMYGQDGAYGKLSVLGQDSRKGNDNITHGISETDTWYHILITYDNLTARVYNNGEAKGSGSFPYAPTWTGNNIRNLAFGCASNGSGAGWSGLFDEFRICAGAMSAERAALEYALMQSGAVTFAVFANNADPLALGDCSLVSNGDGTYAATATLSSGSATSVKVLLSNGAEFELAPSGATAPMTLTGTISGLSANLSFVADVVAVNAGGDIAAKAIPGTFYNGVISVAKTADALEETLAPGAFVFSRAEDASATKFPLVVNYGASGSAVEGVDYEALPGFVTIPAGETSATIFVKPVSNIWTDVDTTVQVSVAPGTYASSDQSATAQIVNCRCALLAVYACRLPLHLKAGVVSEGATLADFPVLVRLRETSGGFSYGDFQRDDHADLAFVTDDGTILPYEIDTWNPDGESLVWVRVPALSSGLALHMLYGNYAAAVNDPRQVWSYYAGVWHLNETAGDATALSDSSANGINGTSFAGAASQTGVVGGARSGRALMTDPGSVLTSLTSDITVTMWVKPAAATYWEHLVTAIQSENDGRWGFQLAGGNNSLRFWNDGGNEPRLYYGNALTVDEWVRFDCVYDRSTGRLYRNGSLVTEANISNWANGQHKADNRLAFGSMVGNDSNNIFSGAFDEVRLAARVSSTAWIQASYKFETADCFSAGLVVRQDSLGLVAVDPARLSADGKTIEIPVTAGSGFVYAIVRNPVGVVTTQLVAEASSPGTVELPVSALPQTGWQDVRVRAANPSGASDERDWSVRVYTVSKPRKIKYTVRGYSGAAVADFPALVRVGAGICGFDESVLCDRATWKDVWFTDENGNRLAFDMDTHDPSGESLFWVRMPTLTPNATVVLNYASQAEAEAEPLNVPSSVWAGQTGVWHMGASGYAYNSAAADVNLHRGWTNGSVAPAIGIIGGARRISNGSKGDKGGNAVVISKDDALNLGDTFTVSGWFLYKTGQTTDYDRLFSRKTSYNSSDGWEVSLIRDNASGIDIRGGAQTSYNGGRLAAPINDGNWHYLTVVYTGTTVSAYENGVKIVDGQSIGTQAYSSQMPLAIGNNGKLDEVSFKGTIDEVRYGAGTLSADRIKADYETVANADFFTAGVYKPGFFVIVR